MMNALSPHMSDGKVRDYIKWQLSRKANTAHLILCNKADGENARYSIYGGSKPDWNVNKGFAKKMLERVRLHRRKGLNVVLWLMTDDGADWNRVLLSDPERYVDDLRRLGFFKYASTVVLGLEMTEYPNPAAFDRLARAARKASKLKIGTHHNSGRADYAGLGDLLFYQTEPKDGAPAKVRTATARALSHGKPVNFFELARNPSRDLCQVALDAGAFGVGNW